MQQTNGGGGKVHQHLARLAYIAGQRRGVGVILLPVAHACARLLTKLAGAMVLPGLNAFKAQLDPNKVGGTAFIGISKPVIKAHGSSNDEAIENAIGQAKEVAASGLVNEIAAHVDEMTLTS